MPECTNISPQQYLELKKQHGNQLHLIDIRSQEEHNYEAINDSVCIIPQDLASKNFKPDDILVFYCQAGTRTQINKPLFEDLKVNKVYILEGGINTWKRFIKNNSNNPSNLSLHKKQGAKLPIMRQVQITIGIIAIIFSILAYFV